EWQQLRDYIVEVQYLNGVEDTVIEGRIVDLLGQDLVDYQMNQLRNRISELEEAIRKLEAENEELTDEIVALKELLAELTEDPEEPENGDNSGDSGESGESGKSGDGTPSEETTDSEEKPGGVLPQTGVNVILPLASGATLLFAGLGAEAYRRKRK